MKQVLRKIGIVAGTVVMAGLTAPLIIPLPPLEGTAPPESLADPESRFIRIGSVNVRYKRRGDRMPLFLLLHGYLRTLFSWQHQLESLGEIGTAVAYDRPAFGLSSRPMPGDWSGPSPYGYRAQAEMAVQLIEALGFDRAILIGHAMGARVAALTAMLYPERVERLVLVAPGTPDPGRQAWQRLFMATPQMRRLGPVMLRNRVARQVDEMLEKSWYRPEEIPSETRNEYQALLRVADWDRALWELARATESLEKAIELESLCMPTLVVAGEKDGVAQTDRIIRTAAAIPHAHLALIPESGHAPQEETPAAFADAIREFLATPGTARHARASLG